jgi:hypothetical protein
MIYWRAGPAGRGQSMGRAIVDICARPQGQPKRRECAETLPVLYLSGGFGAFFLAVISPPPFNRRGALSFDFARSGGWKSKKC